MIFHPFPKTQWSWLIRTALAFVIGVGIFAGQTWATETKYPCEELLDHKLDLISAIAQQPEWSTFREAMIQLKAALPPNSYPKVTRGLTKTIHPLGSAYGLTGVATFKWPLVLNMHAEHFYWGQYSRPDYQAMMQPAQTIDALLLPLMSLMPS